MIGHTSTAAAVLPSRALAEMRSPLHLAAVLLYGAALGSAGHDTATPVVLLVAFFLVTALPLIWRMVVLCLFVGLIVAVLPFLAPIAVILMIVIFILRVGYVIEHWRPIVAGLLVYGLGIGLAAVGAGSSALPYASPVPAMLAAALGVVVVHWLLVWLYRNGYSAKAALGIMGAVPLTIALLILPFLHLFGDAPTDAAHLPTDAYHDGVGVAHGTPEAPGYAHIGTYVRSNPDGIVANNLSYDGPAVAAHPQGEAGTHIVGAHIRSLPDGIAANNLSFHQGATAPAPLAGGASAHTATQDAAALTGAAAGASAAYIRDRPPCASVAGGGRFTHSVHGVLSSERFWAVTIPIACAALVAGVVAVLHALSHPFY